MIPQDGLTIKYMRLDEVAKLRWQKNPKRHDIGAIVESIRRHGFVDPPKLDATLGALVYGNGRDEALEWMHAQGDEPPRGILVADDGMWLMPVKVGVDAATEQEAEALAIAHNNLTMSGGDFTPWDMARMWDRDAYAALLTELAQRDALPVTVDGDALDALLRGATGGVDPNELWRGMPEFEQDDLESWKAIKVHFANEDDYRAFAQLVGQTLTPQTKYIWHPAQEIIGMTDYRADDES